MRSKTWELSTVPCYVLAARPSSPGFLRGPSGLQSEEILFWGAMMEKAEFSFDLTISTLHCPLLPSVKDFSTSEADPEIV